MLCVIESGERARYVHTYTHSLCTHTHPPYTHPNYIHSLCTPTLNTHNLHTRTESLHTPPLHTHTASAHTVSVHTLYTRPADQTGFGWGLESSVKPYRPPAWSPCLCSRRPSSLGLITSLLNVLGPHLFVKGTNKRKVSKHTEKKVVTISQCTFLNSARAVCPGLAVCFQIRL